MTSVILMWAGKLGISFPGVFTDIQEKMGEVW